MLDQITLQSNEIHFSIPHFYGILLVIDHLSIGIASHQTTQIVKNYYWWDVLDAQIACKLICCLICQGFKLQVVKSELTYFLVKSDG